MKTENDNIWSGLNSIAKKSHPFMFCSSKSLLKTWFMLCLQKMISFHLCQIAFTKKYDWTRVKQFQKIGVLYICTYIYLIKTIYYSYIDTLCVIIIDSPSQTYCNPLSMIKSDMGAFLFPLALFWLIHVDYLYFRYFFVLKGENKE